MSRGPYHFVPERQSSLRGLIKYLSRVSPLYLLPLFLALAQLPISLSLVSAATGLSNELLIHCFVIRGETISFSFSLFSPFGPLSMINNRSQRAIEEQRLGGEGREVRVR